MARIKKVVKTPVRIGDKNDFIRKIRYRAFDKVMSEARYLENIMI
jgi:hypothetical protein